MLLILDPNAGEPTLEALRERLRGMGFSLHDTQSEGFHAIGLIGANGGASPRNLSALPGVRQVLRITEPYKLASRSFHPSPTVVRTGNLAIGGDAVVLMAGPCSVENREHVMEMARIAAEAGATVLRGGAFKPRTSPYSFQGLGGEGLVFLREAADAHGLKVISEVMNPLQVEVMNDFVDIYQVGARNMQNFTLLRELGGARKPVLLKRGISATIDEWLMSAEYILSGGNYQVILCERGIRTFETATRNTFDVSAVPVLKEKTHLPVVVDPSHAIGVRDWVIPLARAGVAAGADGLLIEFHDCPEEALSDGPQALYPEQLMRLARELDGICAAIGRSMHGRT